MEQIRSLISILEQDPGNEDAFDDLLQLVTGEAAEQVRQELAAELASGRDRLIQAAQFEAACRILDLEIGNAKDQTDRAAELQREQARLYDEELFDQETAVALYQKSLDASPHEPTERKIEAMETALKLYKLDNGMYPDTEQGLQALVEKPGTGLIPKKWKAGGYLEKGRVPKDPWGNDFIYLSPGVNDEYDIISYGADGVAGGEGKDKDINSWDIE